MGTPRGAAMLLLAVGCAMSLLVAFSTADVVEHTFHVGNLTLSPLCTEQTVVAVNGQVPGPTIMAREGDTIVVHVLNHSPYNVTVHWHGVFQRLSAWADGPSYVTQCPILPGNQYTYRFNIMGQEGTLWWHAHFSYLRANVYGALIIRLRDPAATYPFGVQPYEEVPILLGEWWDANVVQVEDDALRSGTLPALSDAFTINGMPGPLYQCGSDEKTYSLDLRFGETYLLRIINAAVNNQLFFMIAGHSFTVVAVDAGYTEPYSTDVLVLAPGHTVDALLVADADPQQRYYMATRPYFTSNISSNRNTTVGLVQYENQPSTTHPLMPALPEVNDTATAHSFYTSLVSSIARAEDKTVPLQVDHNMFITFGLAFVPCDEASGPNCNMPFNAKFAATMNNISFTFPSKLSMLEASFRDQTDGVFTRDFPDRPPLRFNFADVILPVPASTNPLARTVKATRVKRLEYNAAVEIVLQNVGFIGTENHPIHLHGFNFFVLAQGFGNYDARVAEEQFNLLNPLVRNTVAVPDGGWAVIRFVADNPGVWLMHCHLDVHMPIGLVMAFEVDNGPTPDSTLPPPPQDFPRC